MVLRLSSSFCIGLSLLSLACTGASTLEVTEPKEANSAESAASGKSSAENSAKKPAVENDKPASQHLPAKPGTEKAIEDSPTACLSLHLRESKAKRENRQWSIHNSTEKEVEKQLEEDDGGLCLALHIEAAKMTIVGLSAIDKKHPCSKSLQSTDWGRFAFRFLRGASEVAILRFDVPLLSTEAQHHPQSMFADPTMAKGLKMDLRLRIPKAVRANRLNWSDRDSGESQMIPWPLDLSTEEGSCQFPRIEAIQIDAEAIEKPAKEAEPTGDGTESSAPTPKIPQ